MNLRIGTLALLQTKGGKRRCANIGLLLPFPESSELCTVLLEQQQSRNHECPKDQSQDKVPPTVPKPGIRGRRKDGKTKPCHASTQLVLCRCRGDSLDMCSWQRLQSPVCSIYNRILHGSTSICDSPACLFLRGPGVPQETNRDQDIRQRPRIIGRTRYSGVTMPPARYLRR